MISLNKKLLKIYYNKYGMGLNHLTVEYDEDHIGGQKLIERYNRVSDHSEIFYVDEDGNCRLLFSGSDALIDALIELIGENKGPRQSSSEEINMLPI